MFDEYQREWGRAIQRELATSDTEAIAQSCPQCGANPGNPCVYVLPAHMVGTSPQPVDSPAKPGDATRAVRARVGQPTKRPHNARRYVSDNDL